MVISKARLLIALFSLLVSTNLFAAPKGGGGGSPSADITGTGCSPYMGQATLNEFYKASANQSANSNDFLEFKVLDATVTNVDYDGWTVRVCEYNAAGNNNDSDGCSSHAAVSGFSDSTYPWIVWKGEDLGRYVNFKTGFDAVLKDADGKPIDYFSFKGYEFQYDTSCTYTYDTHHSASGGSAKIIQRKTNDGTADWSHETSGSVDPTEGASNDGDGGSDVDHYSISHSSSGVTCLAEEITITAHDTNHAAVDADQSTVSLSTSTGRGDWLSVVSGGGTLDNGTENDGEATYTFASGSTSVVLAFAHTTEGTVNFDVSDGTISETTGTATASDDPNLVIGSAALKFVNSAGSPMFIPTQISARDSSDIYIGAFEADEENPQVCTNAVSGDKNVNFATSCINPASCISGQHFRINGELVDPVDDGSALSYTPVSINFNASSRSTDPITLNYEDAGRMRINMSLDDPAMTGQSNDFVVRPFAFGFPSINAGGVDNPAGDEMMGSGFTSAGSDFEVRINAYRYQAADDGDDNDGVPNEGKDVTDNGITPNFTGTASLSIASFTPDPDGVKGILGGETTPLLDTYSNRSGADVTATINYDEVGSFNLLAQLDDYLGESDADIQSVPTKIGRFYPDYFLLSDASVTTACSGFAYMQQPFKSFSYKLEARAANDEVTENYDIQWYTVSDGPAAVTIQAENSDDGNDLSGRVSIDTGIESLSGWTSGIIDRTAASSTALSSLTFQRSGNDASGLEDGPFNLLQLGLKITDEPDGRDFKDADKDMQATTAGACISPDCDAIAVGSTQVVRYGRLYIQSAHGPETQDLSVPFGVQYWNGSAFVSSLDDSCTILPFNTITFDGSSIDSVAARTVAVGGGSTTGDLSNNGTEAEALVGSFGLQFSAPGEGNSGYFYVDVTSVPEWLRYDWNQDGAANDASTQDALITFGRARGNDRMIFWQERYQ